MTLALSLGYQEDTEKVNKLIKIISDLIKRNKQFLQKKHSRVDEVLRELKSRQEYADLLDGSFWGIKDNPSSNYPKVTTEGYAKIRKLITQVSRTPSAKFVTSRFNNQQFSDNPFSFNHEFDEKYSVITDALMKADFVLDSLRAPNMDIKDLSRASSNLSTSELQDIAKKISTLIPLRHAGFNYDVAYRNRLASLPNAIIKPTAMKLAKFMLFHNITLETINFEEYNLVSEVCILAVIAVYLSHIDDEEIYHRTLYSNYTKHIFRKLVTPLFEKYKSPSLQDSLTQLQLTMIFDLLSKGVKELSTVIGLSGFNSNSSLVFKSLSPQLANDLISLLEKTSKNIIVSAKLVEDPDRPKASPVTYSMTGNQSTHDLVGNINEINYKNLVIPELKSVLSRRQKVGGYRHHRSKRKNMKNKTKKYKSRHM
jgi:hypothetical protein